METYPKNLAEHEREFSTEEAVCALSFSVALVRGVCLSTLWWYAMQDDEQSAPKFNNLLYAIDLFLKHFCNYLPPHAVVAAGGENNSRNRAKTRSPCLRKVEMTA